MNKHTSVENKRRAQTTKASSFNNLPKRIQREEMKAIADRNNVTTGDVQTRVPIEGIIYIAKEMPKSHVMFGF